MVATRPLDVNNDAMPNRVKTPTRSLPEEAIEGRYKVVREIGQGAAGAVYEGVQLSVDRRVAIKILSQANQAREDYRERFSREAKAIARLSHTNCITLHDFGFSDEFQALYMVMEFVDGVELFELIKDEPLPFRRALNIAIQIAEALAHAHKRGILHRDLKPENVLVTSDDEVKVLDFGLARMLDLFSDERGRRLTAEGAIFGTPAYMSPEQCGGELDVTVHSDIYSLGVVMYQLFEGNLPFDSRQVVKVLTQHRKSPPPPITAPIPDLLKKLIGRTLEKDKTKRPSTATEVAEALRAVLLGFAVDDGELMPDVSQELQRSILSREFPAYQDDEARRTTEDGPQGGEPHSTGAPVAAAKRRGPPGRAPVRAAAPHGAAARLHTRDLIGHRLDGQYEVKAILGEGAMSTVFAAQTPDGQDVAVKVAGRKVPDELRAFERFEREIKFLSQLDHPNIIALRDFGHDDEFDRLYLVTELARGDDVGTLCEEGRTSVELAMLLARDVASALTLAHEQGVTHRDLKPSNIMLCPRSDGTVTSKVLDFGLARLMDDGTRLTAAGMAPGTLAYMSPEQLKGQDADARSDIYSFGAVLYEMLAGHPPFEGKTQKIVTAAALRGGAPPLHQFVHEVPKELSDLIERMMSVEPAGRPESARSVLEQLDDMRSRLGLRPYRVKHRGPSSNPMSDWHLRRRVPRPMPGAGPMRSSPAQPKPGPAAVTVTADWRPSRRRSWVILFVVAAAIGGVAYAIFGLGLGVRDVVSRDEPSRTQPQAAPTVDESPPVAATPPVDTEAPDPSAEPPDEPGDEKVEPPDDLDFIP